MKRLLALTIAATMAHGEEKLFVCEYKTLAEIIADMKPPASRVKVRASRKQCYAPCGIHFTAKTPKVTGLERLDADYQWDFGGKTAKGLHVGHVFSTPGKYTVKVNSKLGTDSIDVLVTEYDGPDYCVRCDDGKRVNSVVEGLRSIAQTRTGRLWIPEGHVESVPSDIILNRVKDVIIQKRGSGADPILNVTAGGEAAIRFMRSENVTVSGISFKGDYSPVTGQGSTWSTDGISTFVTSHVTLYKNSFTGLNKGIFTTAGVGHVIAENFATDWHDYAVYAQHYDDNQDGNLTPSDKGAKYALVDNDLQQNIMAVSGGGGKRGQPPRWADHASFRQQWSAELGVHGNTLTSTTGWSSDGKGHNPPLRYHQIGDPGHSGSITNNTIKGGFIVLSARTMNRQTVAGLGELLVQGNELINSPNTIYTMALAYGDSLVKGNEFVNKVASNSELLPFHYFIELDYGKLAPENVAAPKFLGQNTYYREQPMKSDLGNSYDMENGRGIDSIVEVE